MNSVLKFENKTAGGRKKKVQKFHSSVFCFTRAAEAKCFLIIIQSIYPLSNSNHNENLKRSQGFFTLFPQTTNSILSRDPRGWRLSAGLRIEFLKPLNPLITKLGGVFWSLMVCPMESWIKSYARCNLTVHDSIYLNINCIWNIFYMGLGVPTLVWNQLWVQVLKKGTQSENLSKQKENSVWDSHWFWQNKWEISNEKNGKRSEMVKPKLCLKLTVFKSIPIAGEENVKCRAGQWASRGFAAAALKWKWHFLSEAFHQTALFCPFTFNLTDT